MARTRRGKKKDIRIRKPQWEGLTRGKKRKKVAVSNQSTALDAEKGVTGGGRRRKESTELSIIRKEPRNNGEKTITSAATTSRQGKPSTKLGREKRTTVRKKKSSIRKKKAQLKSFNVGQRFRREEKGFSQERKKSLRTGKRRTYTTKNSGTLHSREAPSPPEKVLPGGRERRGEGKTFIQRGSNSTPKRETYPVAMPVSTPGEKRKNPPIKKSQGKNPK